MAQPGPSNTRKSHELTKPAKGRRSSLVNLAKKIRPSGHTVQNLLSSATLMHPEMYDSSRAIKVGQDHVEQLLEAKLSSPSATISEPPGLSLENEDDAKSHFRSTISSQRHLTFPQSSNKSTLELHNHSKWSKEVIKGIDSGVLVNDSTRTAIENLIRSFADEPIRIHGSQSVHRHDMGPMIELHMLACREDRFVQRLQSNQIARAEIQTMRGMLVDRTTSALDNILVARFENSDRPADIVGWLCCSIIRQQRNKKSSGTANGTRIFDWNLAAAINLNKGYNSGSRTYLVGNPESLRERNDLIEVACRGIRRSQKIEFQDEEFIAITNLVVHPNHQAGHSIRKELILNACKKATKLGLPLYACVAADESASVYKDECGFTELGEHVSLSFEPKYRWKYLVDRPSTYSAELLDTHKNELSRNASISTKGSC